MARRPTFPNKPIPIMPTRHLFIVISASVLFLAACSTATPSPTLVSPTPLSPAAASTPTRASLPVPSAEAGKNNVTAAPDDPSAAPVISFPDPAQYQWVQIVPGLEKPVAITHAGDDRLFIVEQAGRIRIAQAGQLRDAPFLDIASRVNNNGSEQGLLGLAFHPKYPENGFFYINYIDNNGNTVIARFQVTDEADIADPASEKKLLGVRQPYANHNGGQLAFGPDGYLYIGLGDGGSAGDPQGNGQSTNTLLGKILRIDVDNGDPYAIPADNPFASGGGEPEIWAYGLRNPWRFSFDPASGGLYIGDVGQNQWEEIDFLSPGAPGGANFGWDSMEGTHPYGGGDSASFTAPAAQYSHAEGCSVTGGYVYRGQALPQWRGIYLYGDYCSGKVWGLLNDAAGWESALLFETGFRISTFGVDRDGETYLADYGGTIYRLASR